QQDLNLEPGVPGVVLASQAIVALDLNLPFLLCSGVGLLLGPLLALGVIPPAERRSADFLWAGVVGAAMGLTVYASALAFCVWFRWRELRSKRGGGSVADGRSMTYLWCIFGTFGAYVLCLLTLVDWTSGRGLGDIRGLGCLVLVLFLAALLSAAFVHRVYIAAGLRSLWMLVFVGTHVAAIQLICHGLSWWLTAWE